MYVWDHADWGPLTFCEGRVCHESEVVYLFHSEWAENVTFTPAEEVLSEQIMDFWTNFIETDNPQRPVRKPPWFRNVQVFSP